MERRALPGGAELLVLPDAALAASAAAQVIAEELDRSRQERGRFSLALSGGSTPRPMFEALASAQLAWGDVELFQVDERIAPLADDARNAKGLQAALLDRIAIPPAQCHLIPVDSADPVSEYAGALRRTLGEPAVLDLVHLGLGEDGHTASLVPGDPALEISDADVARVGEYKGHPRVSLTFPTLNRARRVLWLVCGESKREVLARLLEGNLDAPAGRITRSNALFVADRCAVSS
ncbi:MAG: 6-phosphogluconolactonase [Myxococcales bacterium]|nr:6-phosphogluconolactonase [Myxococcales bacterium]